MKLTWLGHSCFVIEEDGYRLLTDPYHEVDGYPDLHAEAHEILCSHDHFDHNFKEAVTLLPKRESPFTIRTVATFHDDQQGALRGPNTIHIISDGVLTVAHLGDLGHPLSAKQVQEIGKCDVLLIAVGGFFTLDAMGAFQVVQALGGGTVVPMHYRFGSYDFPKIETAEPFLALFAKGQVERLAGNSFPVEKAHGTKVIVPKFLG